MSLLLFFQGLDEEAIVDHGKSSFTTNTNYEKEDLESKFKTFVFSFLFFNIIKRVEIIEFNSN